MPPLATLRHPRQATGRCILPVDNASNAYAPEIQ
jgi:hypothetical protein